MKKYLFPLFLFLSTLFFSQNQLKVFNASSKKSIINASAYCDDILIGKTNIDGVLSYKTKCKKIDILADNFESEEVVVKPNLEVFLKNSSEKTKNIETVLLKDESDKRALKILDLVIERYKENNPQSLNSYTFKSYSKISADLDKDSITIYKDFMAKRKDSLSRLPPKILKQTEKKKKDSLMGEDINKTVENSQFFLWEKVQQHQFSKTYGEKVTVLDNRISGFQNPIYELMAFNSNLNRIPRQIRTENRELYRYFLADTIEIEGRKNFVIKFRQLDRKQKQNPRKFTGFIYIDCDSYAIKKIESTSKKRNEGNITSIWKPINNKWFLDKENMKIKLGQQTFYLEEKKKEEKSTSKNNEPEPKRKSKSFGNYLYIKNDFFDFEINNQQKAEDFKGYTFSVKNADGSLLNNYRKDTLTKRESETYTKIDSLGKKYKIEKKVGLLTSLMKGNLRTGMVDFDITKFINYNRYEGLRLGAGAKLNEKFNKIVSPDAYFGYGFKDHTWKFGSGIDFKFSQKRNAILRVDYADDVAASGKLNGELWDKFAKIQDLGIDMYNENIYHYKGFGTSFEYDLSNSLTSKIALKKQNQEAKFKYQYQNFSNDFTNFSTTLSLKYAPFDKNMMTPTGKFTYEKNFPQIFLNYEKGSEIFGGKLNYDRIDALLEHQFRTKMGYSNFKFFGGISSGIAPIWKNFEATGLTNSFADNFLSKVSFPSFLGFVTLPSGTFYTDKFVGMKFTQHLPFSYKTFGKMRSRLSLHYQSTIGDFKNPENHQFNFKVLNHYYQEVGISTTNFLGTRYGIGFYYRVGYYQTSQFKDNFGVQIKLF